MKYLKNFENWKKWSPKEPESQIESQPEDTEKDIFKPIDKVQETKNQLNSLIGKYITSIEENENEEGVFRIVYEEEDDRQSKMKFYISTQGEAGWIQDIENIENLYGKVLSVEYADAFLKIKTENGYIVIEFRGPYDYEVELEFAGFDA